MKPWTKSLTEWERSEKLAYDLIRLSLPWLPIDQIIANRWYDLGLGTQG